MEQNEFLDEQDSNGSSPDKSEFGNKELQEAKSAAKAIDDHLNLRRPCVRGREYLHRTHKALGMLPEVFQAKRNSEKFSSKYMLKSQAAKGKAS